MTEAERTELRREVAYLVRKIARVLDACSEQTALLIWANKIEASAAGSATEAWKGQSKRRVRQVAQLH
jgi:hypothetical protein